MGRSIFIFVLISLYAVSVPGQSLFSDVTNSAKDSTLTQTAKLSGFVKSALYTSLNKEQINGLYAQAGLAHVFKKNKFQIKTKIRFTTGYNYTMPISKLDLRECHLSYSAEHWGFTLGNQLIVWGATEAFNPTNNISPKDYFMLSEDVSDRNIPNFMLSAYYSIVPQIEIQWILIPVYKSSAYRFDLIRNENNIVFADQYVPPLKLSNGAMALKLQTHLPSISFSLSAFNGYDPLQTLDIQSIQFVTDQSPLIEYYSKPFRKTTLGGDIEVLLGKFILRSEIALNFTKAEDNHIPPPEDYLAFVINAETNLLGATIILQYIANHVFAFEELSQPIFPEIPDPEKLALYQNQLIEYETRLFNRKIFYLENDWNHAISFHVFRKFQYDQFDIQLNGYYSFTTKEWMIFPKITWQLNDNLKIASGYQYMRGKEGTIFSYTSPLFNNFFMELNYRF